MYEQKILQNRFSYLKRRLDDTTSDILLIILTTIMYQISIRLQNDTNEQKTF